MICICGKSTIKNWRNKHDQSGLCGKCRIIAANRSRVKKPDFKLFHRLYVDEQLSHNQIANQVGLSRPRVSIILKDLNITPRSYADANKNMNRQKTKQFTDTQHQLILGSMLGDACLNRSMRRVNKTQTNYTALTLLFSHSEKQIQYLQHKKKVMDGGKIGTRKSGFGATIKHFAVCHTPTLEPIANLCHDKYHKKSVSQDWLDQLNWCGIAYWFMDDGSLILTRKKSWSKFYLRIHTESFTVNEIDLLQQFLKSKGLTTSTTFGNHDKNQRIITAKGEEQIAKFCKNIEPYVIPEMLYKIRILYNARCPAKEFQIPQNKPRHISHRIHPTFQ